MDATGLKGAPTALSVIVRRGRRLFVGGERDRALWRRTTWRRGVTWCFGVHGIWHALDDARTTERSGISFKRFPTTRSFNTGSTTSASKLNLISYVSWHGTKGQPEIARAERGVAGAVTHAGAGGSASQNRLVTWRAAVHHSGGQDLL
jgi:hypothetical protein